MSNEICPICKGWLHGNPKSPICNCKMKSKNEQGGEQSYWKDASFIVGISVIYAFLLMVLLFLYF